MKKLDHVKINQENRDVWALLNEAKKTGNMAVIIKNLERLRALQKDYIDQLNFQDMEISQLKDELGHAERTITSFEKEWLEEVAKKHGAYDKLKERIQKTFRS
jgi:regulator of replication initiation timing